MRMVQADADASAQVLQLLDGWFAVAAHSSVIGARGSSAAASSRSPSKRPLGRHITWSADIPSAPHSPHSPRHSYFGGPHTTPASPARAVRQLSGSCLNRKCFGTSPPDCMSGWCAARLMGNPARLSA